MQRDKCQEHTQVQEGKGDIWSLLQPETNTTLILEVIGVMCDGQRRDMQNYLREQLDNFKV